MISLPDSSLCLPMLSDNIPNRSVSDFSTSDRSTSGSSQLPADKTRAFKRKISTGNISTLFPLDHFLSDSLMTPWINPTVHRFFISLLTALFPPYFLFNIVSIFYSNRVHVCNDSVLASYILSLIPSNRAWIRSSCFSLVA